MRQRWERLTFLHWQFDPARGSFQGVRGAVSADGRCRESSNASSNAVGLLRMETTSNARRCRKSAESPDGLGQSQTWSSPSFNRRVR